MSQGSVGAAAMMLPPAALFAADAGLSFSGMMASGHVPAAHTGAGTGTGSVGGVGVGAGSGSGMMMMNVDDDGSAAWSSNTADVSNYLSAKAAHTVHTSSSSSSSSSSNSSSSRCCTNGAR